MCNLLSVNKHLLIQDRETEKDLSNSNELQIRKPICLLGLLTYRRKEVSKLAAATKSSIPSIGDSCMTAA